MLQRQNSQNSKVEDTSVPVSTPEPVTTQVPPTPIQAPVPVVETKEQEKVEEVKEDTTPNDAEQQEIEKILQEMEMLQNNGRFRVEMLHQMSEMNKSLMAIASVLVEFSGNDK